MARKKYKIQKAQNGKPFVQSDTYADSGDLSGITDFLETDLGKYLANLYGRKGYSISPTEDRAGFMAERETGQYDFSPEFKAFNALAQLTTGVANKITDVKNTKDEYRQFLEAVQQKPYESSTEEGLNDIPIYTKYGGNVPLVEAEEGEVFTTQDGSLQKVPEGSNTHEEGGVILSGVDRVLEDTSDKRKDTASRLLRVSPAMAKLLGGVDTNSELSHSKLMEKAKEKQTKQVNKLEKRLLSNVETLSSIPNNKYAHNSMNFNMMNLNNIPTEAEIFDRIFDHQEFVKAAAGINMNTAKCGGKYKAQSGIENAKCGGKYKAQAGIENARPIKNITDWTFLKKENGKNYFYKDGQVIAVPGTQMDVVRGGQQFTVDDILSNPKKYKTFHSRMQGAPDDLKRKAAEDLLLKGIMPGPYTTRAPREYGYTELPLIEPADPVVDEQPTVEARQPFNPRVMTPQPRSRFNEPLRWFDVAGPISGLTEGRIPVRYNPVELNQVRLRKMNPMPALQAGQADYNALLNSVDQPNLANVFAKKYSIDNQILGQYENMNTGIKNQEILYNASVRDRQSALDQRARELFETKYLGSKEAQRQQVRTSMDELYQRLAMNRKLNREGNLLMQLFPAFDQYGEYSGYRYQFRPPLQTPQTVQS